MPVLLSVILSCPAQEEDILRSFLLLTPRPYTVYEFQVRCACEGPQALMSDWSSVYKAWSSESGLSVGADG